MTAPIGVLTLKASYGQVSRSGAEGAVDIDGQKANMFASRRDLRPVQAHRAVQHLVGHQQQGRRPLHRRPAAGTAADRSAGGSAPNANSQGLELGIKHAF